MEIINENGNEPTVQTETIYEKVDRLKSTGFNLRMSDYIKEGFGIFKKDVGGFLAFTLVVIGISLVLAFIPIIGSVASAFISPALMIGYVVVAGKIEKGENYGFNNFFDGFQKVVPLFLGQLVSGILVVIGMIFLVIPGIYLAIAYAFVNLIIWFTNEDFWNSMEISRKIVSKEWFSFFGFFILLLLFNLAGVLALGIGLFVTVPVTYIALYLAYKDVVGVE
jgi:uncharacterized membrane protein